MLAGGVFLILAAAALGEFRNFHPWTVSRGVWLALLYLIVAGSIVAFTAYVWLIHHESPTKVGTYAYVNPVVAVLVGYFLGGEALGLRTILGTTFVLVSQRGGENPGGGCVRSRGGLGGRRRLRSRLRAGPTHRRGFGNCGEFRKSRKGARARKRFSSSVNSLGVVASAASNVVKSRNCLKRSRSAAG